MRRSALLSLGLPPPVTARTRRGTSLPMSSQSSLFRFVKRKPAKGDDDADRGPYCKKPKTAEDMAFKKYAGVALPSGWYAVKNSLLFNSLPVDRYPTIQKSSKIAGFDFDNCLANTAFNSTMVLPRDLIHPSIPFTLRALHNKGFRIVIFTNSAEIGLRVNPDAIDNALKKKIGRVERFCSLMQDVPVQVLIPTKYDMYRKQSTKDRGDKCKDEVSGGVGMWTHLTEYLSLVKPDVSESFFVGDASGEPEDHSDADINFAKAVGLKFFNESNFFCQGGNQPYLDSEGVASAVEGRPFFPLDFVTACQNKHNDAWKESYEQLVLILVGPPGSGKSFVSNYIVQQGTGARAFVSVCQDRLGKKEKCLELMMESLDQGKNVIVDRTNMAKADRELFIEEVARRRRGSSPSLSCIVLDLNYLTPRMCLKRCLSRHDHETIDPTRMSPSKILSLIAKMKCRYEPAVEGVEGGDGTIQCVVHCLSEDDAVQAAEKFAKGCMPCRVPSPCGNKCEAKALSPAEVEACEAVQQFADKNCTSFEETVEEYAKAVQQIADKNGTSFEEAVQAYTDQGTH